MTKMFELSRFGIGLGFIALVACGGAKSGANTTPAGGGGGGGGGDGDVGSITIRNGSNYDIYQLQLTPSDEESWGQDLLAGDPLMPGEAGAVPVFECAKYDLRLVDDENVECVVQDIDLCFNDEDWTIDDDDLTACATGWAD